MYAYWVCAARETPIFSPEFPFRSISFSQISKKSIPEHHHLKIFGGFCRSGDHHFQIFFNFNPFIVSHGRLSPNAARGLARRLLAVPESPIFTLKTDQARSGAPHFKLKTAQARSGAPHFKLKTAQARSGARHFHARPGARSGALANFSLCHSTYLPKFGVSTRPPPPPPQGEQPSIIVAACPKAFIVCMYSGTSL